MDSQWGKTFRVLAVGGAPVPGEGLRGGRLGLPERLAEELSDVLSREVSVDAVGDRTLTLAAAADRTGISVKTLRRRIADGSLPAYRTGRRIIRVSPEEVDGLLKPELVAPGNRIVAPAALKHS